MRVFRHFRLHEEDGAAAAVYSVSLNPDGSLLATNEFIPQSVSSLKGS